MSRTKLGLGLALGLEMNKTINRRARRRKVAIACARATSPLPSVLRHTVMPNSVTPVTPNTVTQHGYATYGYAGYAEFGYAIYGYVSYANAKHIYGMELIVCWGWNYIKGDAHYFVLWDDKYHVAVMPFTNAEKQKRFRARLLADPHKTSEYVMKRRQWRKKKEDGRHVPVVQHVTETLQKTLQHVRREREPFAMVKRHEEMCGGMRCMLPLCHPFTAIVSGPTGCGKTAWVLRLVDNMHKMVEPVPRRIWYYYGEYQHAFNKYASVHFLRKVYRS